jgi:hypothetical protein
MESEPLPWQRTGGSSGTQMASDGLPVFDLTQFNQAYFDRLRTAPNATTDIQDAYVRKVIDAVNDLPNALWEPSEEAPDNST